MTTIIFYSKFNLLWFIAHDFLMNIPTFQTITAWMCRLHYYEDDCNRVENPFIKEKYTNYSKIF